MRRSKFTHDDEGKKRRTEVKADDEEKRDSGKPVEIPFRRKRMTNKRMKLTEIGNCEEVIFFHIFLHDDEEKQKINGKNEK